MRERRDADRCDPDLRWRPPSTTADVAIAQDPLERIVGQEAAQRIIRLALRRKAHLLLIGPPGVGKSLLGAAYAHHAPHRPAEDVVVRANPQRPTQPSIERFAAGRAAPELARRRRAHARALDGRRVVAAFAACTGLVVAWFSYGRADLAVAALAIVVAAAGASVAWRSRARPDGVRVLVSSAGERAPFVDATGYRESALLGDVRHDPHQSGAGRTPPHELLEPGAIHEAHGGVLFIDEASTLAMETQQRLLSALQNRALPIVGRTTGSSGTMIRSAPLPCDVAFVLAGSAEEIETLHPALRSRIRGYGYEIHMATTMPDTPSNRDALVRFVAQELALDPTAPPCDGDGLRAIVAHAAVMSGRSGALTLRLRDLGGVVRSAADIAAVDGSATIGATHVREATHLLRATAHLETDPKPNRHL
ncbi:MAG: hypothetical protein NVSMB21_21980 [Vulcanimicrobiaceae bacterium]